MIVTKPPMGWNTWNTFGHNINEELVLSAADALVESGLRDIGYNYVVIDDCWSMHERDENGKLVADPEKFPHGMKYISDCLHAKGLKFGMYSCDGTLTCARYPGSFNREFIDAKTFAEWGVDFLKYDNCCHPVTSSIKHLYRRMGYALSNCGRDILFSACSWGADETFEWIGTTGANMWRSTKDIFDTWSYIKDLILLQEKLMPYHKHGCFNDMDMLIVGMNGKGHVALNGCTLDEYKVHFGFWCLMGSPLMMGCDVRNMDEDTKSILMNKELIKIDQDARSNQPFALDDNEFADLPIIVRLLENGDLAVGFFNLTDSKSRSVAYLEDLDIPVLQGKTLDGQEVYTRKKVDLRNDTIFTELAPHSCEIYRLKIVDIK